MRSILSALAALGIASDAAEAATVVVVGGGVTQ